MTSDRKKEKKSNEQVVNPHDKVVKEFLSEKETAESFFREYLPHEITAGLDFNTLTLSKESFVDKKLSAYFSDLLYEVKSKNQSIFVYLLIEHKSWIDSKSHL
jgi:predicted transposase/invertase (TIGR01784 family)